MAVKAQFTEGEPANLPAAALDALEWLEWLHDYSERTQRVFRYHTDSQARLARAIQALKKELEPHLPHVYLDSNEIGGGRPKS